MASEDSVKHYDYFTKLLINVVNQKHKSNNNKTLGYLNSSVIPINNVSCHHDELSTIKAGMYRDSNL